MKEKVQPTNSKSLNLQFFILVLFFRRPIADPTNSCNKIVSEKINSLRSLRYVRYFVVLIIWNMYKHVIIMLYFVFVRLILIQEPENIICRQNEKSQNVEE